MADATKTTARPRGHMTYTQAPVVHEKNIFHLFRFTQPLKNYSLRVISRPWMLQAGIICLNSGRTNLHGIWSSEWVKPWERLSRSNVLTSWAGTIFSYTQWCKALETVRAPRAYLHDCDSRERPCAPPRLTVLELRTRSAMMIEFQCVHAIQDRMCKAPKIGRGTAVHGIPPFALIRLSVNTPSRPLSPLPHE